MADPRLSERHDHRYAHRFAWTMIALIAGAFVFGALFYYSASPQRLTAGGPAVETTGRAERPTAPAPLPANPTATTPQRDPAQTR